MTQDIKPRAHLAERAAEMLSRRAPEQHEPPPHAPHMPPPSTVTALQAVPPGALIPMETLRDAGLLSAGMGRRPGRAQEEIALVQHQLLRQADEAPQCRIILVASALPREGRSFMALNLAGGIANRGARPVLLVDADGRASSLSRSLGLAAYGGLRDLVAEPRRRATELLVPTALDRLFILPHGRPVAGEGAPGGTAADAILRLAASLPHHIIILDTPACLSSSDASALAAAAGQAVVVVDAQRTARNEVEAALDVLEACPVLQLLLNRVRFDDGGSFGTADAGAAHAP
jgi:receptor protein-tyrosine kinase